MEKLKTIVFDFDGTIANTLPEAVRILSGILPKFNLRKINGDDIKFFRQNGMRKTIKNIGLPWHKILMINGKIREEMKKRIEKLDLIKGIKKVLLRLKKEGYTLGILTGNSKESVEKFLKKNKLEIFDFIDNDKGILSKHIALKKMMKSLNLKKTDYVYVGDEVRDIEACKKVGVKMIAVSWGFNDYEVLKKYNPDWLVKEPKKILDALRT